MGVGVWVMNLVVWECVINVVTVNVILMMNINVRMINVVIDDDERGGDGQGHRHTRRLRCCAMNQSRKRWIYTGSASCCGRCTRASCRGRTRTTIK
jgi:hypothetical protein